MAVSQNHWAAELACSPVLRCAQFTTAGESTRRYDLFFPVRACVCISVCSAKTITVACSSIEESLGKPINTQTFENEIT